MKLTEQDLKKLKKKCDDNPYCEECPLDKSLCGDIAYWELMSLKTKQEDTK